MFQLHTDASYLARLVPGESTEAFEAAADAKAKLQRRNQHACCAARAITHLCDRRGREIEGPSAQNHDIPVSVASAWRCVMSTRSSGCQDVLASDASEAFRAFVHSVIRPAGNAHLATVKRRDLFC